MTKPFKATMAGIVAALALAVVPTQAGAVDAISVYHPDAESRSFTTTDGGFTGETTQEGLCLPPITCPAVTNGYQASGGTAGAADGFLRTSLLGVVEAAGRTSASFTSPQFVYTGAGNQVPTSVALEVSRRADLGGLLSAVDARASFSVDVINDTLGGTTALRVINDEPLTTTAGFLRSPVVPIDPGALVIGNVYRLRITSQFVYGATVLNLDETVDYDDLILAAVRKEPVAPPAGPPGPPGPPGGGGGGGNGGGGGGGGGTGGGGGGNPGGGSAIFDGRRLFIKLKCFGIQNENGKCFTRATALKSKDGARYTFPIQRIVKAKKGKVIRARVRFRFREELEKANKIVLKSVLKENRKDNEKTTKFKTLKLIDRSPD